MYGHYSQQLLCNLCKRYPCKKSKTCHHSHEHFHAIMITSITFCHFRKFISILHIIILYNPILHMTPMCIHMQVHTLNSLSIRLHVHDNWPVSLAADVFVQLIAQVSVQRICAWNVVYFWFMKKCKLNNWCSSEIWASQALPVTAEKIYTPIRFIKYFIINTPDMCIPR